MTDDDALPRPRRFRRTLMTFVPAIALVAFTAAVAAGMFAEGDSDDPDSVFEQGGVTWSTVDVRDGTAGSGATITARVDDKRLDGKDATDESHYVLWMLGSGTYDDRPHVDARTDERALGMAHDEEFTIKPIGAGEDSVDRINGGKFSPSIDGSVTYRDIPAGTYTLRALVMRPGEFWDGTLATRTVEVD